MKSAQQQRLMPYPDVRALEDALAGEHVPVALFRLLLPVWAVRIRATITTSEPYDVIDRYLERGIAEARLTSVDALARFFALDEALVDRALRYLTAIGHVTRAGDRVGLTELGARSVREGRRLITTHEDRRVLYFDAYRSKPLTRAYYDSRDVTFFSGEDVAELRTSSPSDSYAFTPLISTSGFRREELTALAGTDDRERFNLPERIEAPESLGEDMVFLPIYAVCYADAAAVGGRQYLAYSQAGESWDSELSEVLDSVPEIVHTLTAAAGDLDCDAVGTWARDIDPDAAGPVRMPDGSWRVTFGTAAFERGAVPVRDVGSYRLWGRYRHHCVRLWCDDPEVRRRALVERMNVLLGARSHLTRETAEYYLGRVAAQLSLSGATLEALARLAQRHAMPAFAAQLAAINPVAGLETGTQATSEPEPDA